jgi:hypothetical protein
VDPREPVVGGGRRDDLAHLVVTAWIVRFMESVEEVIEAVVVGRDVGADDDVTITLDTGLYLYGPVILA